MKCCICEKKIRVGEHVYPGVGEAWHIDCRNGNCYAVMGSDMKLRWAGGICFSKLGSEVDGQKEF